MTTSPKTAAEREYSYTLTAPEIEAIEVVRLADLPNFSMTIEHRDGAFTVRLVDLTAGKLLDGRAATFEAAWRSMPGAGSDLTISERIAAHGRAAASHLSLVETTR